MITPTDQLKSALSQVEFLAFVRYVLECIPTATCIDRVGTDGGFVVLAGEDKQFEFTTGSDFDPPVPASYVGLLKLPDRVTLEVLHLVCIKIVAADHEHEYPLDLPMLAAIELAPHEKQARDAMFGEYAHPYPLLGKAAQWRDNWPFY